VWEREREKGVRNYVTAVIERRMIHLHILLRDFKIRVGS
jgi:hypothetical protein